MANYNTISRLVNFNAAPPNGGLIAAWNLTDVNDNFGANNLTNNGGVTFVAGKINNCASFDGVNDYLSIADNANISFGAGKKFTCCGWFKLTTMPVGLVGIVEKWVVAGNQREFRIAVLGSGLNNSLGFYVSNNGTVEVSVGTGANTISAGVWYFFCCWYDGTNLNIELNANGFISQVAFSTDIFNGTSALEMGRDTEFATFYNGLIDAVRLYKHDTRVLTATQRNYLYNLGIGREYTNGSNTILSNDVNSELNQLINLFNGNITDITPKIRGDIDGPILTIQQNGNGPIAEYFGGLTLQVEINNKGQLVSNIPTGTAPFSNAAASNGLITNLNVELLDGLTVTQILQTTAYNPTFNGVHIADTVLVGDERTLETTGDLQSLIAYTTQTSINPGALLSFILVDADDDFNNIIAVVTLEKISSTQLFVGNIEISPVPSIKKFRVICVEKNGLANFTDVTVGVISKQQPF